MAFAHRKVALAARRLAHEFYTLGANENGFYKANPNEQTFVDTYHHHFVGPARRMLHASMEHPDTHISVKLEIAKIFSLEETMPKGQGGASPPVAFDDRDWSERA
jgi:hypothetical protein